MDDKDLRFLVLILYNSEFSINRHLLQTTNLAKENTYGDGSGNIFRILSTLQESVILAPINTVMILFL